MRWIYSDLKVAARVPEIRGKVLRAYGFRMAAMLLSLLFLLAFGPIALVVIVLRRLEPVGIAALDLIRAPERWLREKYRALRAEVHAIMPPEEIRERLAGRDRNETTKA